MKEWGAKLRKALDGVSGAGSDLTREDAVARCTEALLKLRGFAGRRDVFPGRAEITLTVPAEQVEITRAFVVDPSFDREVAGRVANELANPGALPVRSYRVKRGDKVSATASAAAARLFALRWEDATRPLPTAKAEIFVGRGAWHGSSELIANDVVLPEIAAISRNALKLFPLGDGFEVEAAGQDRYVAVVEPGGARRRPAFSSTGRITLREGDALEFSDGKAAVFTATLVSVEESS